MVNHRGHMRCQAGLLGEDAQDGSLVFQSVSGPRTRLLDDIGWATLH